MKRKILTLPSPAVKEFQRRRLIHLAKWFLDVYDGYKPPYPARCFKAQANYMRKELARTSNPHSYRDAERNKRH